MAAIFDKIGRYLNRRLMDGGGTGSDAKRKKLTHHVKTNQNPEEVWELIGELGDGAFGTVYKAKNKETGILAACKRCTINEDDDLADFLVEIDILSECHHDNIIRLIDAYHWEDKLWVSNTRSSFRLIVIGSWFDDVF